MNVSSDYFAPCLFAVDGSDIGILYDTIAIGGLFLYHVAIPTDVSLLSLSGALSSTSRRRSRAAGLQRMTSLFVIMIMIGWKPEGNHVKLCSELIRVGKQIKK